MGAGPDLSASDVSGRILPPASVGLGLRLELMEQLLAAPTSAVDFVECAPDNWIGIGGEAGRRFADIAARHPLTCHGLSLSLGGPDPLDEQWLSRTRRFLDYHGVLLYSEHLSYCSAEGQLYELLPLPYTEAAVAHVARRILRTQDILGRRIALENIAYYTLPWREMDELDFVVQVASSADCDLLLDVNNVYVNAANHGYDAHAFIAALPSRRIASYHVAGHQPLAGGMLLDTHGASIDEPVWDLLAHAYRCHGVRPTLLERDFDIPPLEGLETELDRIRVLQGALEQPS